LIDKDIGNEELANENLPILRQDKRLAVAESQVSHMARTKPNMIKPSDAEEHLQSFINKFEPKHQQVIRAARKTLRKEFPTATELVYDNYNFFVIGFGPTERPSDCIVSISAAANGVGLCFIRGAVLPDPAQILIGSGKQARFIRRPSAEVLTQPEVRTLLSVAAEQTRTPLPISGRGRLVIRSVSTKQRPHRKPPNAYPCAASKPAIVSRLQPTHTVGRVVELGSLGVTWNLQH
jgi:hypothetical protein